MTIEEKRAELESNGYEFVFVDGRTWVHTPDEWSMEALGEQGYYARHLEDIIPKAYAHLQKERELAALQAIYNIMEMFADIDLQSPDKPDLTTVVIKARAMVNQHKALKAKHNITEPDDISDATQDRLASVYPDESDTE